MTITNDQNITDFDKALQATTIRDGASEPIDPDHEAELLRQIDTAETVGQVTRRIEQLEALLSETRGFDKTTGGRILAIGAAEPRRRGMEMELHNLRSNVLPYTQARAAEIEAKKAALPTVEQQLQAALERQQRIAAAAQKRAEEIEVEEMAQRIREKRRTTGSP